MHRMNRAARGAQPAACSAFAIPAWRTAHNMKVRIISTQSDTAHRVLSDVVVHLEPPVGDEAREFFAPIDRVAERLGEFQLARQLANGCFAPLEELLEQRCGLAPVFHPLGGRGEPRLVLDRVNFGDPIQRLLGNRRFRRLPHVVKLPAAVRPAGNFHDRTWLGPGRIVQPLKASDMFCKTYRWICCPGKYVVAVRPRLG